MDEFPGLMARDFGFRPPGKSAPMSASKSSAGISGISNPAAGSARSATASSPWEKSRSDSSGFDDVFGGGPLYTSSSSPPSLESIFDGFGDSASATKASATKASSVPEHDKPIYDDDIFDGVPGIRGSSSVKYEDVFVQIPSASRQESSSPPPYDDLLQNFGRAMPEQKGGTDERSGGRKEEDLSGFGDLIPGFGGSGPPKKRGHPEKEQQPAAPLVRPTDSILEDPFVVLETSPTPPYPSSELFSDPLEDVSIPVNSGSTKTNGSSVIGGIFDDPFDEISKSAPLFTSEVKDNPKDKSPLITEKEQQRGSSMDTFEHVIPKMQTTKSSDSRSSLQNSGRIPTPYERNSMDDQSPKSYGHMETAHDVWLTVGEIPLFTQPTSAPPPSRPPPSVSIKQTQYRSMDQFSSDSINAKRKDNDSFPHFRQNNLHMPNSIRHTSASTIDELENFATGRSQKHANEQAEVLTSEEDFVTNKAAAAMKEAVDKAEVSFKHAREVRERERDAKTARSREFTQQERDEKAIPDLQDHEREQMEKEEKEKEHKRREQEREQELEREKQRGRQAVERATREARERAAAEARLKSERASVDKANAEARQRAERAAAQRAASELRERAAEEARERAERERVAAEARDREATDAKNKAAVEARDRAAVDRAANEARVRAQKAAVDRATAEVRVRLANEAREKAAALKTEKQHKPEDDFDLIFGTGSMGPRANSAPKQRNTVPDSMPSKGVSDEARPKPPGPIRKAPSTPSIVDDLTSIFGASPSSGDFLEVNGETEERRRARLERHQRTNERAAKALEEKNKRDFQAQKDQEERHRISETLDIEIKRWASGKEGNLRALLSTLQYVLWPGCGWQPVSLIDLITGASVKKVYRKATLCIHPDKVQQKGATLQQKYIAEKVFDLLKEAWNKFNSEELF